MTEVQRKAPDRPEAERYYARHASLNVEGAGSGQAALQAAINEEVRHSWKLVGVTQDPTREGDHPGVGHFGVLLRIARRAGRPNREAL